LADCLIDVFDTTIDNADAAYITTQTFETWGAKPLGAARRKSDEV
jgi:hypothetical protein